MSEPFDRDLMIECARQAVTDLAESKRDPKFCSKCKRSLIGKDERERGVCSTCEVASWSPDKKKAIGRLVSLGFRKSFKGEPVPDADIDLAIDEAFKYDK